MDLETLQLKETDFPLCFFSDVHGDVDMLRHLFASERNRCRNFFCVGDLVDYRRAPEDNEATVQAAMQHGVRGVRGNHDDWVLGKPGALSQDAQDYFWEMPDVLVLETPVGNIGLFHSVPGSNVAFADEESMRDHLSTVKVLSLGYAFVGHTHKKYVFEHEGVRVTNLGHLGRGVVGDADPSYAVLHADGSYRRM